MTHREPVILYGRHAGIGRVTLNRPDKRNALNRELISALLASLEEADADESIRVVTIEGAGQDFSAGADLNSLRATAEASVTDNLQDVDALANLFLRLRTLRKPVVAIVRGRALAGGCGLATACDLILASESARFGYTEVHIGFVPAMVMAILRRNTSEKRAFELMTTGSVHSAAEMESLGLINHVFPDQDFASRSEEFVAELAERSSSALWLIKRLFYNQDGMTLEAAVRAGADVNVLARMTEDSRAGVARFLEARASRE